MEDRVMLWRLGILVLSTILVAATLILYLGRGFQPTYRLYVKCEDAPNITPETPVKRNGILIGRVDKVDTKDEGGVEMVLRINKGVRLFSDEVARIGTTSLLGESVIEFVPGRGDRARVLLEDKSQLLQDSVELSPGPMEMVNLAFERAAEFERKFDQLQENITNTSNSIDAASKEFTKLAQTVNAAFEDDSSNELGKFFQEVKGLSKKASELADTFTSIGKDIRAVSGDPEIKMTLKSTILQFPKLVESVQGSATELTKTSSMFQQVAKDATTELDKIGKFTDKVLDDELATKLRNSLEGIEEFLSGLQNSEGTIGLLLKDPSVYNRLNSSLRRFESITYQLEPILRDARVFSSKIATDPRMLGVKGALDRRPSGSGVKGVFLSPQNLETETWSPKNLFQQE